MNDKLLFEIFEIVWWTEHWSLGGMSKAMKIILPASHSHTNSARRTNINHFSFYKHLDGNSVGKNQNRSFVRLLKQNVEMWLIHDRTFNWIGPRIRRCSFGPELGICVSLKVANEFRPNAIGRFHLRKSGDYVKSHFVPLKRHKPQCIFSDQFCEIYAEHHRDDFCLSIFWSFISIAMHPFLRHPMSSKTSCFETFVFNPSLRKLKSFSMNTTLYC